MKAPGSVSAKQEADVGQVAVHLPLGWSYHRPNKYSCITVCRRKNPFYRRPPVTGNVLFLYLLRNSISRRCISEENWCKHNLVTRLRRRSGFNSGCDTIEIIFEKYRPMCLTLMTLPTEYKKKFTFKMTFEGGEEGRGPPALTDTWQMPEDSSE